MAGQKRAAAGKKEQPFQLIQSHPIKKCFFQHSKIPTSHRAQTNVQPQISSAKPYCELAVQHPFFETLQSCVCSTATLSHRFKSSPAISGSPAVFAIAGYLMLVGHFSESSESNGDLNRGRRTKSRVLFGYFLHDAKSDNPYSLAGSSEVLQTSIRLTAMAASHRNN